MLASGVLRCDPRTLEKASNQRFVPASRNSRGLVYATKGAYERRSMVRFLRELPSQACSSKTARCSGSFYSPRKTRCSAQ